MSQQDNTEFDALRWHGDEFPEPHMENQRTIVFHEPPANGCYIDFNDLSSRKVVYMSPEEYAEMTQRPMPWTGLTIAAAIVLACAAVALLVHAAGVHGWLR